jgi:hypothetical protein
VYECVYAFLSSRVRKIIAEKREKWIKLMLYRVFQQKTPFGHLAKIFQKNFFEKFFKKCFSKMTH